MTEFDYKDWVGEVIKFCTSLPQTGSEGQVYIISSGNTGTAYVWDNKNNVFVNVSGSGGGGSGEMNTIETISVNTVDQAPDENRNVDITVPVVAQSVAISETGYTTGDQVYQYVSSQIGDIESLLEEI